MLPSWRPAALGARGQGPGAFRVTLYGCRAAAELVLERPWRTQCGEVPFHEHSARWLRVRLTHDHSLRRHPAEMHPRRLRHVSTAHECRVGRDCVPSRGSPSATMFASVRRPTRKLGMLSSEAFRLLGGGCRGGTCLRPRSAKHAWDGVETAGGPGDGPGRVSLAVCFRAPTAVTRASCLDRARSWSERRLGSCRRSSERRRKEQRSIRSAPGFGHVPSLAPRSHDPRERGESSTSRAKNTPLDDIRRPMLVSCAPSRLGRAPLGSRGVRAPRRRRAVAWPPRGGS